MPNLGRIKLLDRTTKMHNLPILYQPHPGTSNHPVFTCNQLLDYSCFPTTSLNIILIHNYHILFNYPFLLVWLSIMEFSQICEIFCTPPTPKVLFFFYLNIETFKYNPSHLHTPHHLQLKLIRPASTSTFYQQSSSVTVPPHSS